MAKQKIRNHPYLLKPVVIVGALVDEKPNFFTIADITSSGYKIPRFIVSSGKAHYTNMGILKNRSFSINLPSEQLVKETDFCGIKSGRKLNKSVVFDVFYGEEISTAPLIREAPINYACKLVKTVDFGDTHYIFIGEIVETYVDGDIIEGSGLNLGKINPFLYFYDNNYWKVGEVLAKAYKIGKDYGK